MVRMSRLRNVPVICGEKQLGLLQSVSLDETQRHVRALIVSCGIRGKRVVLPQDVRGVADGFILAARVQKYKRAWETPACAFVYDATGLLCGRVTDYAIDERHMTLCALEMTPGYLPAQRRERIWVFHYARADTDALCVPACLGSELILAREGDEACACPP